MATALDDPAPVQDEDLVGLLDGPEAVGDDERGAPLDQLGQGLLDQVLGLHVHRRGRVVQDEDARVEQQGARDGDALLLAAGEGHAALADPGVVAVGQRRDEVVDLGDRAARSISSWVASGLP